MSGGRYAEGTTVSVGRTRDEIERTLARYGATGFMFGQDERGAAVAFMIRGRHVRFTIPLPTPGEFALTPTRLKRSPSAVKSEHEKAVRSRWRALGLIVKAKLEAVDAGVVEFDDEFMAQLVMPDGRTVGDAVRGQLVTAIESGTVPALLPGGGR